MRLLVAVEGDIAGHAVRSARLLAGLRTPGSIDLLVGGRFSPLLEASAATRLSSLMDGGPPFLSAVDVLALQAGFSDDISKRFEHLLSAALEYDRQVLRERTYDACVIDGRVSTRVAAAEARIPTVTLVSSVWAIPPSMFSTTVRRALRLADGAVRHITARLSECSTGLRPSLDEAIAAHGLPLASRVGDGRARDLGPLLPEGADRPSTRVLDSRIHVLLTEGTTGNTRALTGEGPQVLLHVPPYHDSAEWVARGLDVEAGAFDLACCHGGMGTAVELLAAGLPLGVRPINAEQTAIAEIIGKLGAGERLHGSILTDEHATRIAQRRPQALAAGRAIRRRQAGIDVTRTLDELLRVAVQLRAG